MKRLISYLSQPKRLVVVHAVLILTAVTGNYFYQVFCVPSGLTAVVLVLCFTFIVVHPVLPRKKWILPVSGFLNGLTLCVLLYCIVFLGELNYLGFFAIVFFGLGLLTYIPHYFAFWIIRNQLVHSHSSLERKALLAGVALPVIAVLIIGVMYHKELHKYEDFETSEYTTIKKGMFTEKILGMHFIYHTRVCIYDGWRPPKHDPLLVIGMWLNKNPDPLDISLEERIALYRKFYPDKPLRLHYSCACQESKTYFNDQRLN